MGRIPRGHAWEADKGKGGGIPRRMVRFSKDVGSQTDEKEGRVFQAQGTACVKAQRSEIKGTSGASRRGGKGIRRRKVMLCAWAE